MQDAGTTVADMSFVRSIPRQRLPISYSLLSLHVPIHAVNSRVPPTSHEVMHNQLL